MFFDVFEGLYGVKKKINDGFWHEDHANHHLSLKSSL